MCLLGLSYALTSRLKHAEAQFKDACRLAPNEAELGFIWAAFITSDFLSTRLWMI
jgi:hypothetical protein